MLQMRPRAAQNVPSCADCDTQTAVDNSLDKLRLAEDAANTQHTPEVEAHTPAVTLLGDFLVLALHTPGVGVHGMLGCKQALSDRIHVQALALVDCSQVMEAMGVHSREAVRAGELVGFRGKVLAVAPPSGRTHHVLVVAPPSGCTQLAVVAPPSGSVEEPLAAGAFHNRAVAGALPDSQEH